MRDATIVKISVKKSIPPAREMIPPESFTPSPVIVATPTTMPMTAQATATPSALRAPLCRLLTSSKRVRRVSAFANDIATRAPWSASTPYAP